MQGINIDLQGVLVSSGCFFNIEHKDINYSYYITESVIKNFLENRNWQKYLFDNLLSSFGGEAIAYKDYITKATTTSSNKTNEQIKEETQDILKQFLNS